MTVDVSTALTTSIHELLATLDVGDDYLSEPLRMLVHDAEGAVHSFLGFQFLISVDGHIVGLSNFSPDLIRQRIATSLRLPVSRLAQAEPESAITFYAAKPGAFIDLAIDLSYALHLP